MMPFGLFWKTLAAFSVTLVILGVALTVHYDSLPKENRPSERFARSLVAVIERRLEEEGVASAERDRSLLAAPDGDRVRIDPMAPDDQRPESPLVRLATAPDGRKYVITFQREEQRFPERLPWRTVWGSLIAGLLFSIVFAMSLSRPIRMLREGFRKLADGRLDVQMDHSILRRNDEFSDLARDFNRMTLRLRALVGARDRLLHDVSHELRSPLTRLQLAIGLARQDPAQREASIARIEQEAHKLESLVDELLTLARAESGIEPTDEFFDPIYAVGAVIVDSLLEADAKGVAIDFSEARLDDDFRPPIAGSAALFQRAFENLLRNAIRFSPPGARIRVDAEYAERDSAYRICVQDRGPGVAPELLGSLLDPFVRSGPEGTGLGLAIADRATRALGGALICRNAEEGGFIAEIRLNLVPDRPVPRDR